MGSYSTVSKKAWRAFITGTIICLFGGAKYIWSLLGAELIAEQGWTATQAALPYTVATVVAGVWAATGSGFIADHSKPKYGLLLCGALTMGGLLLCGFSTTFVMVLIGFGIMLGIASSSMTGNATSPPVKLFPIEHKGIASAVPIAAFGLSTLLLSPITQGLVKVFDTRMTFIIMGIGLGSVIIVLALFMPTPPKFSSAKEDTKEESENITNEIDISRYKNTISPMQALKKREMWVLILTFAIVLLPAQTLNSQVASIAVAQADWKGGYILIMLISIGGFLGRLTTAFVSEKIGCFHTWKLIAVCAMINVGLFTFYNTPVTLMIGSFFVGFFWGMAVPLVWSSIVAIFGKKYVATMYGMVALGFSAAGFAGPIITAATYDATGTYTLGYLILAGMQIVAIILAFTVKDTPAKKLLAEYAATEVKSIE